MAFGINRAQSAEQDRQYALRKIQSEEEETSSADTAPPQRESTAPTQSSPTQSTSRPSSGFRPGGQRGNSQSGGQNQGAFRPGNQNGRATTRDHEDAGKIEKGPNVSLAVEDGISPIQIVRRLLEIAAVRQWPQDQVARLESLAHEDPASAWSKISNAWEVLCDQRREAVSHRDDADIVFQIISDGVVRASKPTGPRAKNMALLHGLALVRLPVERSPFTAEVVSNVAAQQRRMRQEAAAGAAPTSSEPTPSVAPVREAVSEDTPAPVEASNTPAQHAPASPGRFSRLARR